MCVYLCFVSNDADISATVVGLQYDRFWKAGIVKIDFVGRLPMCIKIIESLFQSALCDVFADTEFVGQQAPPRGVGVEFYNRQNEMRNF